MKYLKVFVDFRKDLEPLTDEERGRLFSAMLLYAEDGTETDFSGNERFLWPCAKRHIDDQLAAYRKQCDVNLRNITSRYESSRTDTNRNETVRTDTNRYESKQEKEKEKKETLSKESVKKFVKPTLEEVRAYCKERGNNVNPEAFYSKNESKGWVVGKAPMKDWKAAVRYWETTGYDKPKQQSQYSNEELEKFEVDLLKGDFSF